MPRVSVQCRAMLLILLLAGGDAARISLQAGRAHAARALVQTGDAEVVNAIPSVARGPLGAWWTSGNAVCREKDFHERGSDGATLALNRYEQKAEKLRRLASMIVDADCLSSCLPSYRELKGRLTQMATCGKLQHTSDNFPQDLALAMEDPHDGYRELMMDVLQKVAGVLKNHHVVPEHDVTMVDKVTGRHECGFYPERLDLLAATSNGHGILIEAQKALRVQLFGETCSEHALKIYTSRLDKIISEFVQGLYDICSEVLEKILAGDTDGIDDIIQQANNADASSLLETFSSTTNFEKGEGWIALLVILLLFIALSPAFILR